LRRKKLTIVGAIAQNGAHGSTGIRQSPMKSPPAPRHGTGVVRIIGGRWRGSRLPVTDAAGLRPTPDRVRETLFNWLQPMLAGARVLDLFAGSGALGLEAVSRGAREALLVERDPGVAEALRATVARLHGDALATVLRADALEFLRAPLHGRFDLVFVDPPFASDARDAALALLPPWLADDAWLYLEAPPGAAAPAPQEWVAHRQGATREVEYALYRRASRARPAAATLAGHPDQDDTATE
jgi:16S rRNA (guanine966-N2)-methyltransferase